MIRLETGFLGGLHAPDYLRVIDIAGKYIALRNVNIICTWCGCSTMQTIPNDLPPKTVYIQLVKHHAWCPYRKDSDGISTHLIQKYFQMMGLK